MGFGGFVDLSLGFEFGNEIDILTLCDTLTRLGH
jgi:hypothetical protein